MKFKNCKDNMKVRVKINADSLTKESSNCRYRNDLSVRSAQGKTGIIKRCDASDKTLRVQLDGECDSNWFDPIHLELVYVEPTEESLHEEVRVCHERELKATEKAREAAQALDAFLMKTKVYSYQELTSVAPKGIYKCTDLSYESRFIVSDGNVFQVSGSGTYISIPNSQWYGNKFTKVDATYIVTIGEWA